MPAGQVIWAADTDVIRRLESEWREIADSPRVSASAGVGWGGSAAGV